MALQPGIVTAYKLPFEVLLQRSPLFVGQQKVSIRSFTREPPSDKLVGDLDRVIVAFCTLADTGALGGDSVPPWEACIKERGQPKIGDGFAEWMLSGCHLDERASVILAQMVLLLEDTQPLAKVMIGRPNSQEAYVPLLSDPKTVDPYPPSWPQLPFTLTNDEDFYDSPTLTAVFDRILDPTERLAVNSRILAWGAIAARGAYGVAPVPPRDCHLLMDDTVTFVDEELEWAMYKLRAHPSALNGLINVCAAISHDIAPLTHVRIE